MNASTRSSFKARAGLSPEEDAIGDPDDLDEIDETLPADLWFRRAWDVRQ